MAELYRNSISIIAGQWRGTKLQVSNAEGLRPTSARIRETLFNWLQNDIRGARCLDLFAGSGALGFEAASRGAASVSLVDQHAQVVQQLQGTINRLKAENMSITHDDAVRFLQTNQIQYDLVFLDPPFDSKILEPTCYALEFYSGLTANAKIYIETAKQSTLDTLPASWEQVRSKTAGQVSYHLYQH